jgi:restriction endonuclease Mrr
MAVPTFSKLMLPLLQAVVDGESHRLSDLSDTVADALKLSPRDRSELQPDGKKTELLLTDSSDCRPCTKRSLESAHTDFSWIWEHFLAVLTWTIP